MHWTTKEDYFVEEEGYEPPLKEEEQIFDSVLEAFENGDLYNISDAELEQLEWEIFSKTMVI